MLTDASCLVNTRAVKNKYKSGTQLRKYGGNS